eukprot:1349076-Rhodomonas_salina.2
MVYTTLHGAYSARDACSPSSLAYVTRQLLPPLCGLSFVGHSLSRIIANTCVCMCWSSEPGARA